MKSNCSAFSYHAVGWALAALALLANGCGSERVERVAVQGSVSMDGRPLPKGAIVFEPAGDVKGPSAGGDVLDGRFEIDRSRGPVSGRLRVKITSGLETAASLDDPLKFSAHQGLPPQEPIPPRYNSQSDLFVVATADENNKFEFALQAASPPE